MATPSSYDFETFYHAVCGDLTNKGEVHSMSKQFSLLGDDNERIKFVLEKNFAGSVHWKDFNYTPKDRSKDWIILWPVLVNCFEAAYWVLVSLWGWHKNTHTQPED